MLLGAGDVALRTRRRRHGAPKRTLPGRAVVTEKLAA